MIQECKNKDCKHDIQDEIYKGKRVMNLTMKTDGTTPIVRCTVYGTEQKMK